ncbi:MAG: hypothetical protein Q9M40_03325 [Sulfurimonas sp.]|nr:hypothetical protein [Sulfurimonas sp.]
MIKNEKIVNYPNGNIKTQTYKSADTIITKHYYNGKNAYVREFITLKDGVQKIKHFNEYGILAKMDYFIDGKRDGMETKYLVSRANKSIKSTKMYEKGKLHGECITYNNADIIKQEIFANGKIVLKYSRNNNEDNEITSVEIVDKGNIDNLPKIEYEKLQDFLQKHQA